MHELCLAILQNYNNTLADMTLCNLCLKCKSIISGSNICKTDVEYFLCFKHITNVDRDKSIYSVTGIYIAVQSVSPELPYCEYELISDIFQLQNLLIE